MSWILTSTGKHFDYSDPQPDMVDILDIAQGLSNECRFGGQCKVFYSVAQHCWLASQIVSRTHALEALLHDAAEAYCKDIPRPLKALLPDYRAIEKRVDDAIRERFGLPSKPSIAVKEADIILLATERRDLMPADAEPWPILQGFAPTEKRIYAVHTGKAHAMFIRRFIELTQAAA